MPQAIKNCRKQCVDEESCEQDGANQGVCLLEHGCEFSHLRLESRLPDLGIAQVCLGFLGNSFIAPPPAAHDAVMSCMKHQRMPSSLRR